MVGRTTLDLEDPAHGDRILRVGAEPIDGLGRESHELTVAQRLHGGLDLNLGGSDDTDHKIGGDSTKPVASATRSYSRARRAQLPLALRVSS